MARPLFLAALAVLLSVAGPGQGGLAADVTDAADVAELPETAVTAHQVTLADGTVVDYRASAGFLPLRDDAGTVTGHVFHVFYEATGLQDESPTRPLTFVFNGGPGAASAFLHFGALGPRVLDFAPNGEVLPPPVRVGENPESWLAFTDLVFVDPIGTGYSRAATPEASGEGANGGAGSGGKASATASGERFWGVEKDLKALADFLRRFVSRTGRWASPLYLAGESYGGFRAAALSHHLAQQGVAVSGAVLISPVLEFSTISADPMALVPWAVLLPSLAASASSHGKAPVPADLGPGALREGLAAVERFAVTDLISGLALGAALPEAERTALYGRIAAHTGLPERVVRHARGRIDARRFAKELLRPKERLLSLYDGSLSLPDPTPEEPGFGRETLRLTRLLAPFQAAAAGHIRAELGFAVDFPYAILSEVVFRNWDWDRHGYAREGYPGTAQRLESALVINPRMKVLVVHGVYDLITPYFASVYVLRQLHLPARTADRVRTRVYPGGHMFYMIPDSRVALAKDAAAFFRAPPSGG